MDNDEVIETTNTEDVTSEGTETETIETEVPEESNRLDNIIDNAFTKNAVEFKNLVTTELGIRANAKLEDIKSSLSQNFAVPVVDNDAE